MAAFLSLFCSPYPSLLQMNLLLRHHIDKMVGLVMEKIKLEKAFIQLVKIEQECVILQEFDLLTLNWTFLSLAIPSYTSEKKTLQEDYKKDV